MMKILGRILLLFFALVLLLVASVGIAIYTLPDVAQLEKCFTTSMFKVHLCPDSNKYVRLKAISPYMIHAVIVSEDGGFYHHKGFDWHEIQASLNANLASGKIRRGGSTLTQQLAKNAFLNQEKSFVRKLKEAYLAYQIEQRFKKDLILEKYLNVVEFGPGIYGVKAAAAHYFQKSPSELHPLDSAYLAYLLPNPKVYSKTFQRGRLTPYARKSVKVIVKRMASYGKLSGDGYQVAIANIDAFPWTGLTRDSFHGVPTYSLDAPEMATGDLEIDEATLDELVEETSPDPEFQPEPPADLEE